jgi:hypothetical protein
MPYGSSDPPKGGGDDDSETYYLRMRVPAALTLILLAHVRAYIDHIARKIVASEAARNAES